MKHFLTGQTNFNFVLAWVILRLSLVLKLIECGPVIQFCIVWLWWVLKVIAVTCSLGINSPPPFDEGHWLREESVQAPCIIFYLKRMAFAVIQLFSLALWGSQGERSSESLSSWRPQFFSPLSAGVFVSRELPPNQLLPHQSLVTITLLVLEVCTEVCIEVCEDTIHHGGASDYISAG